MTYTDDQVLRGARRLRILGAIALALAVASCGALDHYQIAPGQFDIRANGIYAHDAGMQREASRACPGGYTRLAEGDEPGPAELGHTLTWRIACNGPSN